MTQEINSDLLAECSNGVLTLTINRPTRKNALSLEVYDGLLLALEQAQHDDNIGVIVLTGAGDAFSAGGDIQRMASKSAPALSLEQRAIALRHRARIVELLHKMRKPTLAMMRGPAVGAGLSLALACDMRIADTSVRLSTGFLKAGVPGDFGGHYFLPRLVGMAKARELYLTSAVVHADEALRIGLVSQVVEPEKLHDHVREIARNLATGPRTAIAYMKDNLNQALEASLATMLDAESFRHARCVETSDHKEAVQAFVDRRPPVFNVQEN